MEILIFQDSELEEFNLRGNLLRDSGASQILFGLRINKNLASINLADNDITDEANFLPDFGEMVILNQSLSTIDLRFNRIRDKGYKLIIDHLKRLPQSNPNSSIAQVLLSEASVKAELIEELSSLLGGGAKKGKKGKKKKGKKKGKKK